MRSLIVHGLDGSGPDHWQTWLAGELESAGHEVRYPDLPEPADPQPEVWREALRGELAGDPGTVICHSLACLLWFDLAARAEGRLASRVLLVAPPHRPDIEPVARFHDHGANAEDVARAAPETLLVCSNDDPYCPGGAIPRYAEPLAIEAKLIPGAGHVNTDAGYGPWPWALEWAERQAG